MTDLVSKYRKHALGPSEVLIPKQTWEDGDAYDAAADKLASMFNDNFKRYSSGVSDEVNSAAPTVA